ncbi:hypothetical protein D6829_02300 [Candidatus Pacearchaeota archaeon]|nr:MAG: hypothetical protein D6829_02300 [Candidatus Pacearchaeota archaeon]
MGLMNKLIEKTRKPISYLLITASAMMPQGCGTVVSHAIESEANSPAVRMRYSEELREAGKRVIDEKIPISIIRKITYENFKRKLEEIQRNGGLEARVEEAPSPFSPSALNPENYKIAITYKGDVIAKYSVKKTDKGYVVDRNSVEVNKNSKLINELKEDAKRSFGLCAAATISSILIALYIENRILKALRLKE